MVKSQVKLGVIPVLFVYRYVCNFVTEKVLVGIV